MNTSYSVLKIVIVHEDLITGIEATAVLRRLAAQLEAEFEIKSDAWQIDCGVWKFEMLHDPELLEQATAEAVAADMIIISACDAELPAWVRDWIENVLPMKEGRPAALTVLSVPGNGASDEPSHPGTCLRRLAEQYGLDYFCNADDQSRSIGSIAFRPERNSTIERSFSRGTFPVGMRRERTCVGGKF